MVQAEQVATNVAPIVGDLRSQAAGGPSDAFSAAIAGRVAADFVVGDCALAGGSSNDGYLA